MVINLSVQYNGGFLTDILLLTQAPIFLWFDGNIILLLPCQLYTTVSSVVLCLVALHGDYNNISAQYNGGLLPDIIVFTQGYYHRGTRLNTM